jgi:predicted secreted protein with PEFG-CTERM motif
LVKREIILLTLCTLFVAYIPFTGYHFDTKFEVTSILKTAYGQTPGPGDPGNPAGLGDAGTTRSQGGPNNSGEPGNTGGQGSTSAPDPSAGDNSTNPSNPGDVSSGIGNSTNVIINNDTSIGPDAAIQVPSDLGNSAGNANATQTVPEFPVAMLVMIISISSVVVFSRIKSFKI